MLINTNYKFYTNTFGINLNSKKLQFKEDDFYVRIKGYGHDSGWAKKIKETADNAVKSIRNDMGFEKVLIAITNGVRAANQFPLDIEKRIHSGILRTARAGWKHGSDWNGHEIITKYSYSKGCRYNTYASRLNYTLKSPLINPYSDISLSRPTKDSCKGNFICHGDHKYINNAFRHIKVLYNDLYSKYVKNEIKKENLNDVNYSIAEIRWILAHATPWERGSDAISNTFIRSMYKSMGIKTFPLKKGVSLDLEAYCTNLDEYKQNFSSYFTKSPIIIE